MTWRSGAPVPLRASELVLIAGPNGSGKTTIADSYIKRRFPVWPSLNADRLLLGLERTDDLDVHAPPAIQAARIVDATAKGLSLLREPFILETVLSSSKYESLVLAAKTMGLLFRLLYVTTVSSTINVRRVRQRTLDGGHDVPRDRIVDRWHRSMDNLPWFASRADRLVVFDNSGPSLKVLALRHLGGPLELRDDEHPAGRRLVPLAGSQTLANDLPPRGGTGPTPSP